MDVQPHSTSGKARRRPRVRFKPWLFRALAVTGALGLSLLFMEIMLWIFAPVPYHQFMNWVSDGHIKGRARPNQTLKNRTGHEIRINHLGFRGKDHAFTPEPGTLRIVVLGGSSTFNFHAKGEEKTWPARL